jgi:AcrR family transcriptional regulator
VAGVEVERAPDQVDAWPVQRPAFGPPFTLALTVVRCRPVRNSDSRIGQRRLDALSTGNDDYKARRQELIAAAARVFQDKGYEAATLSDVAELVGADRATLYYYVSSKEELLREVVKSVIDTNVAEAEQILALEVDAREKVRRWVEWLMVSYEQNYPYTYVFIQEDMRKLPEDKSPWARQVVRQTRRMESILLKLITQGVEEGSFRDDVSVKLAANALFGMLNWTHRWFKPRPNQSAVEVADAFVKVFMEGMGKK